MKGLQLLPKREDKIAFDEIFFALPGDIPPFLDTYN